MNRIIAHIDMNSYFASVEQQANPFLQGKPIGVCGKAESQRTVIAAASREAKKYGIKSGFGVWEAQKLCPNIILVAADYCKYQDTSAKVINIFYHYCDKIEIFSIDEAFLDLTAIVKNDWQKAEKIVQNIKAEMAQEIGEWLTASIGIAENKLMAKLASESKKPDGLVSVPPSKRIDFLFSQKLDDICGIGRKTKQKLNSLGIYTIEQLSQTSMEFLRQEFGKIGGTTLWQMSRGIDDSPVVDTQNLALEKSFGHSYTLPRDTTSLDDALAVLYKLSERACRRARIKKMCGRNISLYIRFGDFTGFATQISINHYTDSGAEVYQIAKSLLNRCPTLKPIRLVGVSLSSLIKTEFRPIPLWPINQKRMLAQASLDKIEDRYGDFTVFPASMTKILKKIATIPDGRDPRIVVNALMKRFLPPGL